MDMFDQSPNDGPSVLTYDNIKEGANEGQDRPHNSQASKRFKRSLDQQDRECRMRNGNVSMTNSTTRSGRPSLPVTRSRSFKSFAAAKARGRTYSRDSRAR